MRQGADPSGTAVALNVTVQLSKLIVDSYVVVACVVIVFEYEIISSKSVDLVVVADVAVVVVAISWSFVNEFNSSAQPDTLITSGVGTGKFDGCPVSVLSLVGTIVPFCNGMAVLFDIDTSIVWGVVVNREIDGGVVTMMGAVVPFCN